MDACLLQIYSTYVANDSEKTMMGYMGAITGDQNVHNLGYADNKVLLSQLQGKLQKLLNKVVLKQVKAI